MRRRDTAPYPLGAPWPRILALPRIRGCFEIATLCRRGVVAPPLVGEGKVAVGEREMGGVAL